MTVRTVRERSHTLITEEPREEEGTVREVQVGHPPRRLPVHTVCTEVYILFTSFCVGARGDTFTLGSTTTTLRRGETETRSHRDSFVFAVTSSLVFLAGLEPPFSEEHHPSQEHPSFCKHCSPRLSARDDLLCCVPSARPSWQETFRQRRQRTALQQNSRWLLGFRDTYTSGN